MPSRSCPQKGLWRWCEIQATSNYRNSFDFRFSELGKPQGPAWAEAWGGMQIQISIWKSCSLWTHLAFPVLVLAVLGWLRGKRPVLLPGSFSSAAHAQRKEARTPSTGGAGSRAWRHSRLLSGQCSLPFEAEPLPGPHLFSGFWNSREPGGKLQSCMGEG